MYNYDTLSEALSDLKARGFTTDFNIEFSTIICSSSGKKLQPHEFEIVEHYRFEGETNPSDESIVYAIEEKNGELKGVLVNAYGMYGEPVNEEMIRKLSINE